MSSYTDVVGTQGPQGVQGPQGPIGPAGAAGAGSQLVAHSETTVTLNNITAEQAMAVIAIPANTLKAGDALRFRFFGSLLQNSGGSTTNFNWRFQFGTISIGPGSVGNVSNGTSHDRPWIAEFVVVAESLTAQRAYGYVEHATGTQVIGLGASATIIGTNKTGTDSLANAINAALYVQMTTANALVETQLYGYTVEKLTA